MKLNVRVIPNAKKRNVTREEDRLKVRVEAPAVDGKANSAVIETLAKFFSVKRSRIKIVKGEKSREKVIEINQRE